MTSAVAQIGTQRDTERSAGFEAGVLATVANALYTSADFLASLRYGAQVFTETTEHPRINTAWQATGFGPVYEENFRIAD
jgi:hypothetical protein